MSLGAPPKPALTPALPPRGMLMCLVGPAGCGKSSFAAQFPSPEAIIDPRDEGLIDLIYEQQISMKLEQVHKSANFEEYKSNLSMAVQGRSKTIICESITGIQAMCYQSSSKNDYDNDLSHKKFLNYQNGPITAAEKYFQVLLDLMLKAQNLGKHVILIGHTVPKQTANLEGDDYLSMLLGADKQMTLKIKATFMNIFVIAHEAVLKEGTTRASSQTKRWLFAHENPKYPSKNRMGIQSEFLFPTTAKGAYLEFCTQTNRDLRTAYRRAGQ